ncbi:hypothetical protein N2152v2_002009 [Parachlorella kessleri]
MSLPSTFRNAYDVLGLEQGATLQQIKEQYKKLAKQHHPDLCPLAQRQAAETQFKELTAAYTRLTARGASYHQASSDWRAAYAETVANGHSGQQYYARAPGGVSSRVQTKFSSGVVAAVLALPLILSGIHLARAYNSLSQDPWRPGGVLAPPRNPYLRDDLQPTTRSRRSGLWAQWLGETGGLQRKVQRREGSAAAGQAQHAGQPPQ